MTPPRSPQTGSLPHRAGSRRASRDAEAPLRRPRAASTGRRPSSRRPRSTSSTSRTLSPSRSAARHRAEAAFLARRDLPDRLRRARLAGGRPVDRPADPRAFQPRRMAGLAGGRAGGDRRARAARHPGPRDAGTVAPRLGRKAARTGARRDCPATIRRPRAQWSPNCRPSSRPSRKRPPAAARSPSLRGRHHRRRQSGPHRRDRDPRAARRARQAS